VWGEQGAGLNWVWDRAPACKCAWPHLRTPLLEGRPRRHQRRQGRPQLPRVGALQRARRLAGQQQRQQVLHKRRLATACPSPSTLLPLPGGRPWLRLLRVLAGAWAPRAWAWRGDAAAAEVHQLQASYQRRGRPPALRALWPGGAGIGSAARAGGGGGLAHPERHGIRLKLEGSCRHHAIQRGRLLLAQPPPSQQVRRLLQHAQQQQQLLGSDCAGAGGLQGGRADRGGERAAQLLGGAAAAAATAAAGAAPRGALLLQLLYSFPARQTHPPQLVPRERWTCCPALAATI
jgi:hypothetical protein